MGHLGPSWRLEPVRASKQGFRRLRSCCCGLLFRLDRASNSSRSIPIQILSPLHHRVSVTSPLMLCDPLGEKTASTSFNLSRFSRIKSIRWVLPSSSSPSAMNFRLTGISSPEALIEKSALRKAISGPLLFVVPLPTRTPPNGDICTTSGLNGSFIRVHLSPETCFTSYIRYTASVFLAPAS